MVLLPTNSAGLTCSENCNTFGRYRPLRVTGRIAKCLILWNGSLQAAIQKGLNTAHNPKVVSSNLTPATMGAYEENPLSALLISSYEPSRNAC